MMIFDWIQKKRSLHINKKDTSQGINCIRLTKQANVEHCMVADNNLRFSSGLQFSFPQCDESVYGFSSNDKSKKIENIFTLFHGFLAVGALGFGSINELSLADEIDMSQECNDNFEAEEPREVESNGLHATVFGREKSEEFPLYGYFSGLPIESPEEEDESIQETLDVSKIIKQTSKGKNKHKMFQDMKNEISNDLIVKKDGKQLNAECLKRKANKIIKLLCKKVHPESTEKCVYHKNDHVKKNVPPDASLLCNNLGSSCPNMALSSSERKERRRMNCMKHCFGKGIRRGIIEHWIKTDQDYLVLELQQRITLGDNFVEAEV